MTRVNRTTSVNTDMTRTKADSTSPNVPFPATTAHVPRYLLSSNSTLSNARRLHRPVRDRYSRRAANPYTGSRASAKVVPPRTDFRTFSRKARRILSLAISARTERVRSIGQARPAVVLPARGSSSATASGLSLLSLETGPIGARRRPRRPVLSAPHVSACYLVDVESVDDGLAIGCVDFTLREFRLPR